MRTEMKKLRLLDLFSGIGGFSLAARWTGRIETAAFCEINETCLCKKLEQKINSFSWSKNWTDTAACLCGVDDGLPFRMDGFELTRAGHRRERLSALGNSIVPVLAWIIFEGILKLCRK